MVTMVKVKMRKGNVKNRHYNINILFIYSEQMTESDIDFDQNDHDHDDHGEPAHARQLMQASWPSLNRSLDHDDHVTPHFQQRPVVKDVV